MMKRWTLLFLVLALATAGAKTYRLTLFETSQLAGAELEPGEYKVEVKDNKAIVTNGSRSVEAPVKVETNGRKFASTSVRYESGDGKYEIQEICLGGTRMRLLIQR